MASLGTCWEDNVWVVPSWETDVWCPESACIPESIGDCWEVVWCQGTWQNNTWCPTTPPTPIPSGNFMIGGVPIQDPLYWRKKKIWNDDEEFIARQLHDV